MLPVRKSDTRPFVYKHTSGYYARFIWGTVIAFVVAAAFPAFFLIHSCLGEAVNKGEMIAGCVCLIIPLIVLLLIPLYAPQMKKSMRDDKFVSSRCNSDNVHTYKVVDCILCTQYEGTFYELRHLYTPRPDDTREAVKAPQVAISADIVFKPVAEDFELLPSEGNSGLVAVKTCFKIVIEAQDECDGHIVELTQLTDVPKGYYIRVCWIDDNYYLESIDDEPVFSSERT